MKEIEDLNNIIKSKGNNSIDWRNLLNELRNDNIK